MNPSSKAFARDICVLLLSLSLVKGAYKIEPGYYALPQCYDITLPARRPHNGQSTSKNQLKQFITTLPFAQVPKTEVVSTKTGASRRNPRHLNHHFRSNSRYFEDHLFNEFLNKLPISDTESDEESPRQQGIINIKAEYDGELFYGGDVNLQQQLFNAAIDYNNIDFDRASLLLDKKKHFLLSSNEKSRVMEALIYNLRAESVDERTFPLLDRLLNEGFYHQEMNLDLYPALFKQKSMEVLLAFDRNLFKLNKTNFIKKALENNDYELAEIAIIAGSDPKVIEDGRNSLDLALASNLRCQRFLRGLKPYAYVSNEIDTPYCMELEEERHEFIEYLRKIEGLNESMTFENFKACCSNNENRFDYAMRILQVIGNEKNQKEYLPGDKEVSPLSVAIESEQYALIKAALDLFLGKLKSLQLLKAKSKLIYYKENLYCRDAELSKHVDEILARVDERIESIKASFST